MDGTEGSTEPYFRFETHDISSGVTGQSGNGRTETRLVWLKEKRHMKEVRGTDRLRGGRVYGRGGPSGETGTGPDLITGVV